MSWRPQVHFTTDAQWINDPNGLVHLDGEYHLFHQFNPYGNEWGNISWGHAVSADLLRWRPLEPALTPYPAHEAGAETLIFSGSAVTASDGSLLAFYTAHERRGDTPLRESVGFATSHDAGRTWQRHPGNPVLDRGRRDFRDPKVLRHEGRLAMVVAVPDEHRVEFYASADEGLSWELTGAFAAPEPTSARRAWECPDLVHVPTEDGGHRWALLVSADHPADDPYSGMFAWVGQFDGATFVADRATPQCLDHGKDFFAAVTYNGLPDDERPVLVGWASNWAYASVAPPLPWRGMMALPRELMIVERQNGLVVAQRPCRQFDALAVAAHDDGRSTGVVDVRGLVPAGAIGGVRLRGADGRMCEIGVDARERTAWCDRRDADALGIGALFATRERAPIAGGSGPVDLRVLRDGCLVEVFVDGGATVLTELAFVPGVVSVDAFGAMEVEVSVRRVAGAPERLDGATGSPPAG
jgi:fructan beta-fructosidase